MSGFFTKQETQLSSRPDGKTYSCFSCGLYKRCNSPKMKPTGEFQAKILNVFEYPDEKDDRRGELLRRKEDRFLDDIFISFNMDLKVDCINTSALKCAPIDAEKNEYRKPTQYEIDCCRIHLLKVVKKYKPVLIIAHGEIALKALIGHRYPDIINNIEKWRGFVIPDQDLNCFIAPVYSLSYVLSKKQKSISTIYKADLGNALFSLKNTFPIYKPPTIKVIKSLKVLDKIKNNSIIAFDYETTGLKPHDEGHRIICASVAISEDKVYVFMMPRKEINQQPFIRLLKNKYIKKMAHNMKFEETWSLNYLGTRVRNWFWDSMLVAHILDNRDGITGLKFQTYINFGVIDYSSEIAKWLKATEEKNANAKNRIVKLVSTEKGKQKLLEYCALDSIFEYRLAMKQQNIINKEILPF